MNPFTYLPDHMRESLKKPIKAYVSTYYNKLSVVFEGIDAEAEQVAEEEFERLGTYFNPDRHDPADFAERAWEYGIEYAMSMNLMRYNVQLMSISTLYQFWEQQVRSFLFEELTRDHTFKIIKGKNKGNILTFKEFCTKGFDEIKEIFQACGRNLESFNSYAKINELRLLANVIKHGDGPSATQLKIVRPDIFNSRIGFNKMDLYKTTLNEVVLEIGNDELRTYGNAILEFWDEIPEYMYFQ